ncbi:MAG: NAD(P)/FAD-dependent oxidoreductase [Bacteroidetes bacterium]|nr:NAD(P)/FAD-dependent oxidoreductase [Bacteroidota bacterium]
MLHLQSNFIFPPIKLGYASGDGRITQKHLEFYGERNKYIGAITAEPLYMDQGLRELPTQLGIDNDNKLAGLKLLNETLHQNGSKSIAHLNHPGRMANPKIPGNFFWSSTDNACENGGAAPKKMDRQMMNSVIELFVESAKRAVLSDFDIIELQFGHGYLMAQFISPAVNDRTDDYGGSFKNRIKFPIEVIKAVREVVNIPIIARISGDEMIPDGFHIEDMVKFSQLLENNGVAAIHVSAGTACSTPPWFFQHMFIPKGKTWDMAGKIKQKLNIPIIFVGKINSARDVHFIEDNYHAEYMAVGRALVADPDFVGKYYGKEHGLIRPCLACAEGCLGGVKSGQGLGCVVNPRVNTGLRKVIKDNITKNYAVVGGGLAGMQAAITLRDRGHLVDLYEKDKLGGQFNMAYLPPNKENMKEIVDYFIEEMKVHKPHKVNVIHQEATISRIKSGNYDAVIMATGAIPAIPPIKGLKKYYWTEFLEENQLPNSQKVLVIGGGLIGIEVASKLVDANNHVVIVEMLDEIARGMEMIEKAITVNKLKAMNAEIYVNYKVVEIDGDRVLIEGKKDMKTIENVDKIVVATGMNSYVPFNNVGSAPVYFIGDAQKVGKAQDAIHDAYALALNL